VTFHDVASYIWQPLIRGECAAAPRGRALQVDPIKPTLKAPGTKRFRLSCNKLLSNVVFKFNLRRYSVDAVLTHVQVLRDAVTELLASPAPFAAALAALDAFTAGVYTRSHFYSP